MAPLRFPLQKVMVIPLVERLLLQTDRTTTYSYQAVDLNEFAELGPHIETLRVLTITKNRTANHAWRVDLTWSHDGMSLAVPFIALSAEMTADAQVIHTEYTSSANFCARILKIGLGARNSTGAAAESAIVSAWLVVTFKS